jgi:hypothetical protein
MDETNRIWGQGQGLEVFGVFACVLPQDGAPRVGAARHGDVPSGGRCAVPRARRAGGDGSARARCCCPVAGSGQSGQGWGVVYRLSYYRLYSLV